MTASPETLPVVLARLRRLAAETLGERVTLLPLGCPDVDLRLGGGLRCGVLHEIIALTGADGAAATGFALGLAARVAESRPILWVRQAFVDVENGRPHGAGLAELGIDPTHVLLVSAPDAAAALKAAHEGALTAGLGAVLLDLWGEPRALDLTAAKRLSLAAGRTGATMVLLRIAATPASSAATTRWTVRASLSRPLPANAPGPPAFLVRLVRHQSGVADLEWHLEWDRERGCFKEGPQGQRSMGTAPPRPVVPIPAGRADPEDAKRTG